MSLYSFLLKIIYEFVFKAKDNGFDAIPQITYPLNDTIPQKYLAVFVTIPHF